VTVKLDVILILRCLALTTESGDPTFGANVATTLLTPLAEVEEDISFSPTLMVVLTALACEYAGRISVSPLHLIHGLSKRLIEYAGPS